MQPTVKMIEVQDFSDHEPGNRHCASCEVGYPRACRCGGLIHAEIAKARDDGLIQITRCDRCGLPG